MVYLYDRLPVPVYPPALQVGDVLDFLPLFPFPSILLGVERVSEGLLYRLTLHNLTEQPLFPSDQPLPLIHGLRAQKVHCARCSLKYEIVFDVAETNAAQLTCLVCPR
ncbi:hypothetical protein BS329_38920 [Amycolatopsis coloradensis]|uniref:Uncharacterized protein n=1 Tax=Amycolatopsis coloradensis TaxID=76021 RepID=A0A1R0KEN8_9PSEU|nr:hypothetical protein [Amycolatopsis coloradensis]OLZ43633.1 hypothetical protein BS329_38920 [Amycolatopsis coloradensis]